MTASPQDAPSGDSLPSWGRAGVDAGVLGRSEGAREAAEGSPRISDADLSALAALVEAATPAPWTPALVHDATTREAREKYLTETLQDGDRELWVAWAADGDKSPDDTYLISAITGDGPTSEANAAFVANARNLIGSLIAEIQGCRAVTQAVWVSADADLDGLERRAEG